MPAEEALAALGLDNVKVEQYVKEFLSAQSLKILPKTPFGDAVTQFVDKDDKYAVEQFVVDSLAEQIKNMLATETSVDDVDLDAVMDQLRDNQESLFATGNMKLKKKNAKLKPRPATWDTDMDGEWEDEPGAWEFVEGEEAEGPAKRGGRAALVDSDDNASIASAAVPAKTTGRKAPAKKPPSKPRAPAKAKGRFHSTLHFPFASAQSKYSFRALLE